MYYLKDKNIQEFIDNEFNIILNDISSTIIFLPEILTYINAGYNFHNARERVFWLKRRKQIVNYRNEHPTQ